MSAMNFFTGMNENQPPQQVSQRRPKPPGQLQQPAPQMGAPMDTQYPAPMRLMPEPQQPQAPPPEPPQLRAPLNTQYPAPMTLMQPDPGPAAGHMLQRVGHVQPADPAAPVNAFGMPGTKSDWMNMVPGLAPAVNAASGQDFGFGALGHEMMHGAEDTLWNTELPSAGAVGRAVGNAGLMALPGGAAFTNPNPSDALVGAARTLARPAQPGAPAQSPQDSIMMGVAPTSNQHAETPPDDREASILGQPVTPPQQPAQRPAPRQQTAVAAPRPRPQPATSAPSPQGPFDQTPFMRPHTPMADMGRRSAAGIDAFYNQLMGGNPINLALAQDQAGFHNWENQQNMDLATKYLTGMTMAGQLASMGPSMDIKRAEALGQVIPNLMAMTNDPAQRASIMQHFAHLVGMPQQQQSGGAPVATTSAASPAGATAPQGQYPGAGGMARAAIHGAVPGAAGATAAALSRNILPSAYGMKSWGPWAVGLGVDWLANQGMNAMDTGGAEASGEHPWANGFGNIAGWLLGGKFANKIPGRTPAAAPATEATPATGAAAPAVTPPPIPGTTPPASGYESPLDFELMGDGMVNPAAAAPAPVAPTPAPAPAKPAAKPAGKKTPSGPHQAEQFPLPGTAPAGSPAPAATPTATQSAPQATPGGAAVKSPTGEAGVAATKPAAKTGDVLPKTSQQQAQANANALGSKEILHMKAINDMKARLKSMGFPAETVDAMDEATIRSTMASVLSGKSLMP